MEVSLSEDQFLRPECGLEQRLGGVVKFPKHSPRADPQQVLQKRWLLLPGVGQSLPGLNTPLGRKGCGGMVVSGVGEGKGEQADRISLDCP